MVQTGYSKEGVHKQEVLASKKTYEKCTTSTNHKIIWLLRMRRKLWEGQQRKRDSDSVAVSDGEICGI